ncbi:MAG: hypothetical protein HY595_02490 [Candidatus Omnitrophica bacterium]|nr:hypothetical protein [Candidatus Omnitrophota bacterium]
MSEKTTGYEELFVETDDFIRQKLVQALKPWVGLQRDSDQVAPREGFTSLPQQARILTCLLARHAMVQAGVPGASLELSSDKIAEQCFLAKKGCKEQLSRMKATGLVELKGRGEGYFVPRSALQLVCGNLQKMVQ